MRPAAITIVIPAYNEAARLPPYLAAIEDELLRSGAIHEAGRTHLNSRRASTLGSSLGWTPNRLYWPNSLTAGREGASPAGVGPG